MKRQQGAFAGPEKMLKGALHSHTTRSDGKMDPAEVIRLHAALGYDFLALTDHQIYNYKNFAPETPITILPGMEFGNTFVQEMGFRCFHTVCLGPKKEDGNGFEQDQRLEPGTAPGQEEYQAYLDSFHQKNNLTIYCHPQWSSTPPRYFEKLQGNFAMEVWNSGCALSFDMDCDAAYWDDLLGQGQRVFGVATDDGHKKEQFGNGWVMVRSENTVPAILSALKNGNFYSTCGPEIYDFYVEDGMAVVKCSPACKIRFHGDRHPTRMNRSEKGDLTSASCDASKFLYIRAVVIDAMGRHAWTNPIFLDEKKAP